MCIRDSTKLIIEDVLRDLHKADPTWGISILRYFNPVGAHASGEIGEDPTGVPANLTPYIAQVAVGRRDYVPVLGNDYDTPDGTGVRDYIHVIDLAKGHVKALQHLAEGPKLAVHNLGTGRGYSVLETIAAFERASGRQIARKVEGRRPGDIAICYADPTLAEKELGWKAELDIDRMCRDLWRWQEKYPNGFRGDS